MSANRFHEHWVRHLDRNREYYRDHFKEDCFDLLEKTRMPGGTVGHPLEMALDILYTEGDCALARCYLRQTVAMAERALKMFPRRQHWHRYHYPADRGLVHRVHAYARALLGEPLDETSFRQAAVDIEEGCSKLRWDVFDPQGVRLMAARAALLGNDHASAARLLRHRFNQWLSEESRVLLRIVAPRKQSPLDQFDACFDERRDPARVWGTQVYHRTETVLDLAAIRDRFLVSEDGVIDWQRVNASIVAPAQARS